MSTLSSNLNALLRAAIHGGYDTQDVHLLSDYLLGSSSAALTAANLLACIASRLEDAERICYDLAQQIIFLSSDYAFLQDRLVQLVHELSTVVTSVDNDFVAKAQEQFQSLLSMELSDVSRSRWYVLLDKAERDSRHSGGDRDGDRDRDRNEANELVALYALHARILAYTAEHNEKRPRHQQMTGFDDALFIISHALEDENMASGPHIACAAQYFLHATESLWMGCRENLGRDQAHHSPLWSIRGKMWEGEAGYGVSRCDFWQGRLRTLSLADGLFEDERRTIERAVRAIELQKERDPV